VISSVTYMSRRPSSTMLCPQVLGVASAFVPAAPAVRSWVNIQDAGAFTGSIRPHWRYANAGHIFHVPAGWLPA